ncbi:BspA family leucine-rich repeat surface protein [Aquimarina sp. 433]
MKHIYTALFLIVSSFTVGFAQDEFIITWQATDDQKELSIPTSGSGYNYTVDWGDGVIESNQTGISFHTYASNGIYTVKIQGVFPSITFGNNPDFRVPAQLVSVEQWGSNAWTDMTRAFSGCTNLVINATDIPDLSNTTSLEKMFDGTTNFVDNGGQLGNWNVSTIENMIDMFRNSGMNVNIGLWNVGNVIDFTGMFTGNTAFNQNIDGWNIGEFVTGTINMRAMFDSASSFNSPLNTWDISRVINMSSMFGFATAFNQPLDNWDTSSVENMGGMFFGASDFDQNVGDWNLSSVTAMGAMFQLAGLSTTNYDATLIGWATQDAGETIPSNISISFEGSQYCIGEAAKNTLTSVPYNWSIIDDGAACASTDFFITTWQTTTDNESITIPTTGAGYNYAVDWGDGTIETGFTGNATHEYSTSGNYTVKIIGDFPRIFFNNQGDRKKIMSIEQWGDQEWQNMAQAFNGCENLKLEATDLPNLSQVINATRMFANTTNFEDLGGVIGQWNTGNINNMNAMFISSGFNEEIGNWDVSKVTNFSGMFYDCPNFNQNLANWDLSEAVNMRSFISTTSLATSSFSMENYDKTLKGWATLTTGETRIPRDLVVGVNLTRYCDAFVERNLLVSDYGWRISDLGLGCPENDKFITTWEVAAGETITIPTFSGESYRYVVEWGDNTTSAAVDDTPLSHTYEFGRTYRVKITGEFPRIYFNNTGSRNKIISIDQWGTQQWDSMNRAFAGCSNLVLNADDVPDLSTTTDISFMFAGATSFEDHKDIMNSWDVSNISNMWGVFDTATAFNENITSWNVGNVTNFSRMFYQSGFSQNIGGWNIGEQVTGTINMTEMFARATSFNQDLSNWDMSKVSSLREMFRQNFGYDQSLGDWDISSVTDMRNMLFSSGLSTENYDQTLIGWTTLDADETQIPVGITFNAGNSTYCLGESARNTLTAAPYNWIINDMGQACITPIITLLGDNPQVIEKGDMYTELGAEVTYGATLTINSASVNTNQVGSYTVTYDAINTVSGETAMQVTRTVDVVDTTAPIITLNGANPQTIELGAGYTELGATTDDGSAVSIDTSEFMDAVGSYTIYYDATDAAGNVAIQVTRTVDVVDTTVPVITLNGANPQTIELGAGYTELGATTDDGSAVSINTSEFMDAVGSYTIYYDATDAAGNAAIQVTRTVDVVDTTAPVITLNGANPQTIELGAGYNELGATTDDGSAVSIDTSEFMDAVGSYTIYYDATDATGNAAIQVTRTVDVVDTTNPTVVCQNITVQLDDTGNATITAAMIDNGSTDLSGIASIVIDVTDFDCTNIGDNMVMLTVTDTNGNTDMCMATVTVEDEVAPEFDMTTVPMDMEVPFDTGNMYTLADFTSGVVVTDNCDTNKSALATTITQSPVASTLLAEGDHVITLTATDDNLNIETVSFTITVSGVLSVEENTEDIFSLYPNPATDQFWITGVSGEAEVTFYDINGRMLQTIKVMNEQAISTTDLSEGVYLIRIEQNDINQTMRLMKN